MIFFSLFCGWPTHTHTHTNRQKLPMYDEQSSFQNHGSKTKLKWFFFELNWIEFWFVFIQKFFFFIIQVNFCLVYFNRPWYMNMIKFFLFCLLAFSFIRFGDLMMMMMIFLADKIIFSFVVHCFFFLFLNFLFFINLKMSSFFFLAIQFTNYKYKYI